MCAATVPPGAEAFRIPWEQCGALCRTRGEPWAFGFERGLLMSEVLRLDCSCSPESEIIIHQFGFATSVFFESWFKPFLSPWPTFSHSQICQMSINTLTHFLHYLFLSFYTIWMPFGQGTAPAVPWPSRLVADGYVDLPIPTAQRVSVSR